jgi:hypothetical protein
MEAVRKNNVNLLVTLTSSIRFEEGIWFFGFGFIAFAVGTTVFQLSIWMLTILNEWSGIPLAV